MIYPAKLSYAALLDTNLASSTLGTARIQQTVRIGHVAPASSAGVRPV